MSRDAKPIKPGESYLEVDGVVLGDGPPAETYPLKQGGRPAVPDRSEFRGAGAACPEARQTSPPLAFTEELRSGAPTGSSRGNDTPAATKTFAENIDAKREARGIRTRPPRPGQWGYG